MLQRLRQGRFVPGKRGQIAFTPGQKLEQSLREIDAANLGGFGGRTGAEKNSSGF